MLHYSISLGASLSTKPGFRRQKPNIVDGMSTILSSIITAGQRPFLGQKGGFVDKIGIHIQKHILCTPVCSMVQRAVCTTSRRLRLAAHGRGVGVFGGGAHVRRTGFTPLFIPYFVYETPF